MACLEKGGALYGGDPTTSDWSLISPTDPAIPHSEARSYHELASDSEDNSYLHASYPAEGPLYDLWSFHVPSEPWTILRTAPKPARRGTSMAFSKGCSLSAERI